MCKRDGYLSETQVALEKENKTTIEGLQYSIVPSLANGRALVKTISNPPTARDETAEHQAHTHTHV